MNTCQVYKSEKSYKIVTESLSTLGMGISTFPIHVLPINSDSEELKNSIVDCIKSSKDGLEMSPDSDEFAVHSKNVLKALQEKSHTNLYKSSKGCSLEKHDWGYHLTLYKLYDPGKPRYGFVGDKFLSFENVDQVVEFITGW
ncbi:hypothetical protein D3C87_36710 [compost metagenome]